MGKVNTYKNTCWFTATVEKAFLDGENRKHIIAVASDNLIDRHLEFFTEKALMEMVACTKERRVNKPEIGRVRFVDNHLATFSLGYAVDGGLVYSEDKSVCTFKADIVLKDNQPSAMELFDEVMQGTAEIQLSVGGHIPNWSDNVIWEEQEFVDSNTGVLFKEWVMKIDSFYLDHIACTPPDKAANPRTFVESYKSTHGFIGEIYKSLHDNIDGNDVYKVDINEISKAPGIKELILDIVKSVFKNKEEILMDKEKDVKGYIEKIKSLDLGADKLKEFGISFITGQEGVMEVTKAMFDEMKSRMDSMVSFDEEKVKSLISELSISEEKINTLIVEKSISEEKVKELATAVAISEEKVKSLSEEIFSGKIGEVINRVEAVEKAAGVVQSAGTGGSGEGDAGGAGSGNSDEFIWG